MAETRRGRRVPRTLLEQLIWQGDWTYEELSARFERIAREQREPATISVRHLQRLAAGHRSGATPATRRVLRVQFGYSMDQLAGAPRDAATTGSGRANQLDGQPASALVLPLAAATLDGSGTDVEVIRAVCQAFQIADRKVGGGRLYSSVARYLNIEIGPRLLDAADPAGSELFAAAACMTEIAGWMAHDGGQDLVARRHLTSAYRLAVASDHPALAGNVCSAMAHLANQLGEHTDAVRIAEVGLDRARDVPDAVALAARLHAMRAHGLAHRGDARACRAALETAAGLLGDDDPDHGSADWVAPFDVASLAGEAALCLHSLGDLDEAETHARRVLELREPERVRARALAHVTLASVLVRDSRLDEAARVGQEICSVAPSLTSARVTAGLDRLGEALRPHRAVADVGTFLEQLAATKDPAKNGGAVPAWPV